MPEFSKVHLCFLLVTISGIGPALGDVIGRRDTDDSVTPAAEASPAPEQASDCKEVQYPCTRVYSVQKPVKQCISYLCVTSVRRVYILNKEICTKIMCKEDELMQEDKCRQLAGLPPRRLPQPPDAPVEVSEEKTTPQP
ncbi:microfibrillar-associated protein 5 isoform X2 [Xenopus laevis]|uniref:Microfibrillar-associated protein 5 isoform X2 n=1 Tax=Xenopus laevis TaxID=8355 RepID=A0A8J1LB60_XENLA|nr:microfibrillar-associated protein 5 isoform X2 [Xenopus laevis]